MSQQQHVEVVHEPVAQNQQVLWQPVVGEETTRLLADSDLDENAQGSVVTQAVEVLQRCAPPRAKGGSRTGLVVGYVQSGKTMSFTTVIGLARDNGFPLVVLLAGTKENLHEQTASRLARDLAVERAGGLSPWYTLQNPNPHSGQAQSVADFVTGMLDSSTPEQFRRTTVLTVMKNPTRLKRVREFIQELEQYGVDLDKVPVLVVDDEADQAGLNAGVAKDDTTATYQGIIDLRKALPHHSYVMYTATPQAPLLVNLADTLSPDFVTVLEPGEGYTGGQYFFDEHKGTFVKRLTDVAVTEALDPGLVEPPDDLQQSMATYFLVLANRGKGPVSMLVHPSHKTDLHDRYGGFVQALRSSWHDLLKRPEGDPDRRELVETWFVPAYQDLAKGGADLKPLDELLKHMAHWIGTTQVRVVNSGTPADSDIAWNASPSWILVGGNKLDRGFTVEGLAVTYMPRKLGAGQVDSVQQRARFFGYKNSYGLLCRAWLAGGTADAFEHYVEHEQLLRQELQDVVEKGISLKQWTRMMLLDPKYKPTRKAVIDLPYMHGRIPGDRWVSVNRLGRYGKEGASNRHTVQALISKHKAALTTDTRDQRTTEAKHKVLSLPVAELIEQLLLDWQGHPDDRALVNQAVLLLRARLDEEPDLVADVYLMDSWGVRKRSVGADGSTVTLQQGRSPDGSYKGDQHFFTDGRVSVQLHLVQPIGEDKKPMGDPVPGVNLRVPATLAGGVLIQYEDD
ncbi:Z1 domain-containing protein [Nocardioides sp. WL0053]|uniref:Z1 domain-containing protein n=1 Tax=Nocardioides jiangsuensis TaxID=2866161 RepID=A0ABS7RLL3_9ACTN|nr:Z1 domain-containing protein [Nocardioides jiangsuensis]MBY9075949.1 Z1 domain-containing protein [Nocardioides jiangsuensis]